MTTLGRNCAVCGGAGLRPHLRVRHDTNGSALIPSTDLFGTALADIVRCSDCGHMQLERFPAQADLSDAYGEAVSRAYVEEEVGQRRTARVVLERIEAHARPGRLLDLGCWVGFLLAEARDRGWRVQGVEPSDFASRHAREDLGLDVVRADLFEADLPQRAFDAVVLGDVIEHLPRPGDALERVASLLAAEGVLCLTLPDAGSRVARVMGRRWWSVIPPHVQYFTRASLALLLERHGFRAIEISTQPKAFTVRYYLTRVEGYSPPLGRSLVGAAARAGLADRHWAPDFRDRMLVIARRRA